MYRDEALRILALPDALPEHEKPGVRHRRGTEGLARAIEDGHWCLARPVQRCSNWSPRVGWCIRGGRPSPAALSTAALQLRSPRPEHLLEGLAAVERMQAERTQR